MTKEATALLLAVFLGGCFASHGRTSGSPPDAGTDASAPRCGGALCASGERCCGSGTRAFCQPIRAGCPVDPVDPTDPIDPIDPTDPGVPCGRGGSCAVGETCCSSPVDAVRCAPPGASCDAACFEDGECGAGFQCVRSACSAGGQCQPIDPDCPAECDGVCACDDLTYCNACEARNAGAEDWTDGPCSDDPQLGICERVCARVRPVCGISITACSEVCASDLSDCTPEDQARVERCASFKDCGEALECLSDIPCIDTV